MNHLKHLDEFKRVLTDYHLSDEAKATIAHVQLVLLVGPSSSGRNTIMYQLVKSGGYYFVVSDTTRQPRVNNGVLEQNGREYWFRSEEEVLEDLKGGKFLEAAIIHNQQVSGTSIRELKAAADEGKIAIDEIEVVGADNIHRLMPAARFIFVLPPSFDEWMARMNARGELPKDETRRRMESAVNEITTALASDFYIFMVNDTFMHSTQRVDAIIHGETVDPTEQTAAKEVAKQILADTKQHLAELS